MVRCFCLKTFTEVDNRNSKRSLRICSKLTITSVASFWRRSFCVCPVDKCLFKILNRNKIIVVVVVLDVFKGGSKDTKTTPIKTLVTLLSTLSTFSRTGSTLPANIYFFKVNNKITLKRFEICSKLTIKPPKRQYWVSTESGKS